MNRQLKRRVFLLGSLGALAAWEAYPVGIRLENASGAVVSGRRKGDPDWRDVEPGATGIIGTCRYHGLCNPPARWLSEDFDGIEIRCSDGTVIEVSRAAFEVDAVARGHNWYYRFERT
ncbi:MAG: hypothetical protein IPH07_30265 [Deltaproteobacteria bacterium]|nr:hypothetical protein [Deltaproteobacteria bacterium]MBK8715200.1 hypothetical protein [Deltaproteobacteria bacterium]MBP7285094.1 hypothetical protein [Nannocystaceae bacterium]